MLFAVPSVTETIAKSAPQIIKEAASSPLGIIALCVLVFGAISYVYFSRAKQNLQFAAFVMLVLALLLFVAAASRVTPDKKIARYSGKVLDAVALFPIRNAKASLDLDGPTQVEYTDSEGVFSFKVSDANADLRKLTIEADSYIGFDKTLAGSGANIPPEVRLHQRGSGASTAPSGSPGAQPGAPVPTPARCDAIDVRSGPQPSGSGKGWSNWYSIRSGPSPTGCAVANVEFRLSGDRQCGAWSECQEVGRSDSGVEYKFRLQGHEEDPPPKYSEGHLHVSYKPL
jgi:hypothetical protein